ncbi:aspartate racemase protein [Neofusicoccum parvum]|nr:aspartate racemase protein [Neofusicoccum parvum]
MASTKALPPLGFIAVELDFLRPPGDGKNERTWPFPLITRTAKGSQIGKLVTRGAYPSEFIDNFVDAGKWLADQGCVGLITSCGFLAMAQPELAARLPIPIATSSLIQIPAVRALLPAGKTVGVITFDEARLGPLHLEKLGIADAASIPVVGPPADGHLKRLVRDGGPYSQSGIEEEMVACARRLVEDHAGVGAIVLECVQMPPFAAAVQKAVGLPTYDVFTLGCWFYSGLARSPFAAWSAEEQEAVDRVYPREADLEPGEGGHAGPRPATVLGVLADLVVDLREMRKVEDMLESSDRSVMAFKDSHLHAVGSVSVVAALISQLSSTTLQMPGLSHVHWTAPGCIIASLLFGVLAVILSTFQQQTLGMLNNPEGVRMWLSNGHFYPPHALCRPRYDQLMREVDERLCDSGHLATPAHFRARAPPEKRRLQVSIAALQLLSMPHKFLSAAVVFFLAGFALYLGFAFRQDLDDTPARNNNEAVFILFVAIATTTVFSGMSISLWKVWEVRKAGKRSDKDSWEEHSEETDPDSEESGYEADESQLLGSNELERRGRPKGKKSRKDRHDEIAQALEEAARLHKRVARLMRDEVEEMDD